MLIYVSDHPRKQSLKPTIAKRSLEGTIAMVCQLNPSTGAVEVMSTAAPNGSWSDEAASALQWSSHVTGTAGVCVCVCVCWGGGG